MHFDAYNPKHKTLIVLASEIHNQRLLFYMKYFTIHNIHMHAGQTTDIAEHIDAANKPVYIKLIKLILDEPLVIGIFGEGGINVILVNVNFCRANNANYVLAISCHYDLNI